MQKSAKYFFASIPPSEKVSTEKVYLQTEFIYDTLKY